jgi:hypothetical protein
MKTSLAFCALALVTVLVAACTGNGLKPGTDGGADLSVDDLAMPPQDLTFISGVDLAGLDFKGVSCGNQTCGTGQSCCVVPDGQSLSQMCVTGDQCSGDGGPGLDATCDGPEDCSGGTPSCCAEVGIGGGAPSGGAMCTATCTASATQSGGGMLTTKLCHSSADCTNFSGATPFGTLDFDSCCSYTGISYNFCAPGLLAGVAMGISCQP